MPVTAPYCARLAIILFVLPLTAGAQPTDSRRGLTLIPPDSVGAAFALSDSAARIGKPTDYDDLIGTWTFRFQGRNDDGSYYQAFTGHWTFEKKPGGGLIEDRWRPDDPSVPMGSSLHTWRVWDDERRVWQIVGASTNGGAIQLGLGWSYDGTRVLFQPAGTSISRFRYYAMGPDRFSWRSDRSYDGGRTWILDFAVMEATRVGR